MTISAFDVDSFNKPGFDFGTAFAEGYRAGYIKLGGDNLNPRYCGSGYQAQFDAFAAQPFEHRGCYWVTGGPDPVASAQFYLAHRDPRTTFDVLDNESLDDGWAWSDDEACAFFDVLIAAGLTDLWQYGSRDSLWNQHEWPGLEARGIKAIVAIYNDTPFQNINPRTYPAALVKGHQFTSSATIGGLGAIDENAFTDDAFENQGEDMTPEQSHKLDAIYDALFKTSQVSASTTGGNPIPGGVLRTLSALYDADFLSTSTSLGTPGGVLVTLKAILDKLNTDKPTA